MRVKFNDDVTGTTRIIEVYSVEKIRPKSYSEKFNLQLKGFDCILTIEDLCENPEDTNIMRKLLVDGYFDLTSIHNRVRNISYSVGNGDFAF